MKGLRHHPNAEQAYVQQEIRQCRHEIRNGDASIKSTGLLKLVYIEMLGYDISWAAFAAVEAMSDASISQKRIGYLVAKQTFCSDTEEQMLAINLIKKVCIYLVLLPFLMSFSRTSLLLTRSQSG